MSFVHYLTVGRLGFTERSVPPNLMARVVAHFVPGGLRQLGGETSFIVPWNEGELIELEEAVKVRYGLELDLGDYVTADGLLSMQYTGVETHIAYPVAAVAAELFGASAGERGQICEPSMVRATAEEHSAENDQRRRIAEIPSAHLRLQAVVEARRSGASFLPPWLAERVVAPVAATIVPELVALLGSDDKGLRQLAIGALREAGPAAAAAAVPALTGLLRDKPDPVFAFLIAFSLAGMGQGAEPGLVEALDHEGAERTALEALAKLPSLSEATRARLAAIAGGADEVAAMARHALGDSAIAKRLARLRNARPGRDPQPRSRVLAERLRKAKIDEAQLRFAAYLGDTASQVALTGSATEPPADLRTWATGLLEARPEWSRAVAAAALDARSATLRPRSAALAQAVAEAIREATASTRFEELLEKHDWMEIPGMDFTTLQNAVAAAESMGEDQRQHLLRLMETLDDCGGRSDFLLLLHEEAIPLVLGEREAQ